MNKEEQDRLTKRIGSILAAPIGLIALMNLLIDKGVITKEELLKYIEKDKRVGQNE